jgi:hypothetical protein
MEENTETGVQSQQEFSFWNLPIFTLLFVVLITAIVFYPVITSFQAGDPAAAGSATWRAIFFLIIGYLGGSHAAKNYAPKINGNQSWAFIIPYTFSLVGFGCYWLYYLYKRDKPDSQHSQKKEKSIFRTILMIIGVVVLVIFILVILSYIILGSGISTTQKSYETFQGATVSTIAPVVSSTTFYSYENKSLGFKINYPASWNYQTGSGSTGSTYFFNPDGSSIVEIDVGDLSSDYSSYSVDDLTNTYITSLIDPKTNKNDQLLSNEAAELSNNYAREVIFTYTAKSGENLLGVLRVTKKDNKVYALFFGADKVNFTSQSPIVKTMFNSFTIETKTPATTQGTTSIYDMDKAEMQKKYGLYGSCSDVARTCLEIYHNDETYSCSVSVMNGGQRKSNPECYYNGQYIDNAFRWACAKVTC